MPHHERLSVDGILLTPRMQNSLAAAARYARRNGHDYIGTEHVLLAFLNDEGGIGPSLIARFCDTEEMEETVRGILEAPPDHPSAPAAPPSGPA